MTAGWWLAVAVVLSMASAVAGHVGATAWTWVLVCGAVGALAVWRRRDR